MSNVQRTTFNPILQFRHLVTFPEYDKYNVEFSVRSVGLPKWSKVIGWSTPISMTFYKFELENSIETVFLDLLNNQKECLFRINIFNPFDVVIQYWDVVANVTYVDFGNLDRRMDDVAEITVEFVPIKCEFVNLTKEK